MKIFKQGFLIGIAAIILFGFSGCAMLKTIRTIGGGELTAGADFTMPVNISDNTIFVKVRIDGSERLYDFIFDTGAINAVNLTLARELGLNEVSAVDAVDSGDLTSRTAVFRCNSLSMGDITVVNAGLIGLDLNFVSQVLGHPVDGIIGNNFVKYFAVTLNYQDSTMSFAQENDLRTLPDNAVVIPFRQSMNHGFAPQIICKPASAPPMEAIIDCGNSGSVMIPAAAVTASNLLQNNAFIQSTGAMSAGAMGLDPGADNRDYLMRLNRLEIGSLVCENILVQSVQSDMCLIGQEFLSRFITTVDYPNKRLILIPVKDPLQFPDNRNEGGFGAVKTEDGEFRVIGVWEHSAADSAGLKIGDLISHINGMSADSLSNKQFRAILNDPSIPALIMTKISDNTSVELTIPKRNLLPE